MNLKSVNISLQKWLINIVSVQKHTSDLEKFTFQGTIWAKHLKCLNMQWKEVNKDPVYWLWAALTLYYLFLRTEKAEKKLKYAIKIQKYGWECLKANYYDLNAAFILINLYLSSEQILDENEFIPEYTPEDLAVRVKQVCLLSLFKTYIQDNDNHHNFIGWQLQRLPRLERNIPKT